MRTTGVQKRAIPLGNLVETAPRRSVCDHDVDGRRRRGARRMRKRRYRGLGQHAARIRKRSARRVEAVFVPPVGKAPVEELGRVRTGVDADPRAIGQRDLVLALVEERDAFLPGAVARRRPEGPGGGPLGVCRGRDAPVVPVRADEVAVQRQVVVAGDDELDGGVDVLQHVQRRVVLRDAAGHGEIPTVDQQVRRRQRRLEGGARRCGSIPGVGFR